MLPVARNLRYEFTFAERMTLLQRYVLKSTSLSVAGALAFFALVLAAGNVLRDLLSYLADGILSPATFAYLFGLLLPFVGSYALPMGMLTGVLLVMGRLSADFEITAMRAAGMSLYRITAPVFWIGSLGAVMALGINFIYMPRARVGYHAVLDSSVRANPLGILVPKTFVRAVPNAVIYVGSKEGLTVRDFWCWELDKQSRVVRVVHAGNGSFAVNSEERALIVTLTNVQIERRDQDDPEDFTKPSYVATIGETTLRFSLDALFGPPIIRRKLAWMTFGELHSEIRRLAALPDADTPAHLEERMKVKMAYHEKCSSAFSVFTFAFVAIPLGIQTRRKETSANLGLALLLVMAYYFLTIMVGWLDRAPQFRPDLLLWLPNVLFVAIGIWLFRRADRT